MGYPDSRPYERDDEVAVADTGPTAIDRFDRELDRLAMALELLSSRLQPVSEMSDEKEQVRPIENAKSPLVARVIRLGELTGIVDRLIRDLDI